MDMKINDVIGAAGLAAGGTDKTKETGNFAEFFSHTIEELNGLSQKSQQLQQRFVTNGDVELQDVMIAGNEAELALKLTMQVRNKVLDAYREIMRMSV
jgi:flagellar hook-basal body complex protein FliE